MAGLSEALSKAGAWAQQNALATVVELVVNFALPFAVFSLAKPSLGEVYAMMTASTPPILWSIAEFVRRRRIDALSLLVLAGIALSLLAFIGGGGAKLLQLREHLVIAVIGLIFLGSAAIGRPLIHQLARARTRRTSSLEAQVLEEVRESPIFRRAMMVMTLAWGVGLLLESAIACVLVFALTIPQFLLVSPIVGYGMLGGLTAWTYWYARRRVLAARAEVAKA
ncbi:MAG: VC0807 family protein [Caulobacterales bacterium]